MGIGSRTSKPAGNGNNVSQMPTPQQPQPQRSASQSVHHTYAEEALRTAQRYIDQVAEIEDLTAERDDWRRKAMDAQLEIRRLQEREATITELLERRSMELTNERDSYRNRLVALVSQFQSAGSIILKCLESAELMSGPKVDLKTLANEIERVADVSREQVSREQAYGPHLPGAPGSPADSMLPRIATTGPRTNGTEPPPAA